MYLYLDNSNTTQKSCICFKHTKHDQTRFLSSSCQILVKLRYIGLTIVCIKVILKIELSSSPASSVDYGLPTNLKIVRSSPTVGKHFLFCVFVLLSKRSSERIQMK